MKLMWILLLACLSTSWFAHEKDPVFVPVDWVQSIDGDFSFKDQWSYPEGVYRNKFRQLSCDGFCPETDRMKDERGKIHPDSLAAFYQFVDTTHLHHSINSATSAYEWAGTDFMIFKKGPGNSLVGKSLCNASTHSSLNMDIRKDSVTAWIEFNSSRGLGSYSFPLKHGQIKIEKQLLKQGVVKAAFDLTFVNTLDLDKKLYWKGLFYSKVED